MVSDTTIRERKKALFLDVSVRLEPVWPGSVRSQRNADGMFWFVTLPGGVEAQVHLATIKDGLPVGEFAVDPTLIVRGGPPELHTVPHLGAMLLSKVSDGRGVRSSTDGLEVLRDWIVLHIREQFIPEMLECAARVSG